MQKRRSMTLMAGTVAAVGLLCAAGAYAQAAPDAATAAAKAAQGDLQTETIYLSYQRPSDVVTLLKSPAMEGEAKKASLLPAGIVSLTPQDIDNTLVVRGTAAAVTELKTILRILDVKPRQAEIKARLVKVNVTADGQQEEQTLQKPTLLTKNNTLAKVTVTAGDNQSEILVTPHINGDNSISMMVGLKLSERTAVDPPTIHEEGFTTYRRLKPEEKGRFGAIAEPKDDRVLAALQNREALPAIGVPYYVIYVEASARELTDKPRSGATP